MNEFASSRAAEPASSHSRLENLNLDTLREIYLHLPYIDLKNACKSEDSSVRQLCNDQYFWKLYLKKWFLFDEEKKDYFYCVKSLSGEINQKLIEIEPSSLVYTSLYSGEEKNYKNLFKQIKKFVKYIVGKGLIAQVDILSIIIKIFSFNRLKRIADISRNGIFRFLYMVDESHKYIDYNITNPEVFILFQNQDNLPSQDDLENYLEDNISPTMQNFIQLVLNFVQVDTNYYTRQGIVTIPFNYSRIINLYFVSYITISIYPNEDLIMFFEHTFEKNLTKLFLLEKERILG